MEKRKIHKDKTNRFHGAGFKNNLSVKRYPQKYVSGAVSYVIAIASVALATLARAALDPFLGTYAVFALFYVAVTLTGAIGGRGPALAAAFLSTASVEFFFMEPRYSIWLPSASNSIVLLVFLFGASAIAWISGRLHNALRTAEARAEVLGQQAALIDLSPDGIIVRSIDGTIRFWSRGAESLYGWNRKEALGQNTHELFQTQFPQPHDEILRQLHQTRRWSGELIHRTKAGEKIVVRSWWLAEFDDSGQVAEIFESNVDITERKLADQALQESEKRFRTLAEAIPQLVWMTSSDGLVYWYNRRWYEYTGTTAQQVEGLGWQSVVDPNILPKVMERWKTSITTGEPFDMENPLRGADGKFHPFLIRIEPLKDNQGNVIQWFGTATDISKQKDVQEALLRFNEELEQRVSQRTAQLQEAVEELQRSNADLEQFAYISSHDLQEPLRMVATYVAFLKNRYKDKLDQAANEYIEFAVDASVRMSNLIKDLLAYSRVTREGKEPQVVDANAILTKALASLRLAIEETGAKVTYDQMPTVQADPTQLTQIFQNLIENAIKYRKDNVPPVIHLSAGQNNGLWVFTVQDNGIGIRQEYQNQIFTPFKRLHSDRSKYPGTGIGLAIVRRIVERHHGRVCVDSQPDEGSTFYFTLPVSTTTNGHN